VRVYAATANHDIGFHQVHELDGGRIRYKRFCEVCGAEVAHADIVKGYETEDGELVTLDDEDMAGLPTSTGREIEVVEFVPAEQVDPLLLDRSYYLEPDSRATKPYALLREALRQADRMAVAKVALRQRETLALLRVRGQVIVLQTMLWPDETSRRCATRWSCDRKSCRWPPPWWAPWGPISTRRSSTTSTRRPSRT
jgi:DNA end-binding protein Ku